MSVTVGKIIEKLNSWAPFESAEKWDNVGLLVGDTQAPVTKVMTSLDVSPFVIEQAAHAGAELIVSHHPVIFNPLKKLDSGDIPYRLARLGIAAVGLHTNLDKAKGGVNDVLAELLGLEELYTAGDGLCRIGILAEKKEPTEFATYVGRCLQVPKGGIQWMGGNRAVRTVGVCSGAGGDYLLSLLPLADAFVTGELHYHEWPPTADKTVVAAGHFYTEVPIAEALAAYVSEAFPELEVKAAKEHCPYRFL